MPKIFAQEVLLSGETYIQNGNFSLAVNSSNPITRGLFADGWPKIKGYISATPKNAANVLLASDKEDPILSVMQYGLGHTVADDCGNCNGCGKNCKELLDRKYDHLTEFRLVLDAVNEFHKNTSENLFY